MDTGRITPYGSVIEVAATARLEALRPINKTALQGSPREALEMAYPRFPLPVLRKRRRVRGANHRRSEQRPHLGPGVLVREVLDRGARERHLAFRCRVRPSDGDDRNFRARGGAAGPGICVLGHRCFRSPVLRSRRMAAFAHAFAPSSLLGAAGSARSASFASAAPAAHSQRRRITPADELTQ